MVIFLHIDGKGILYFLFLDNLTALRLISKDLDHSMFETIVVANFDINHFFSFAFFEKDDLENALINLITEFVVISVPEDAF